jgi:hypothetical protein
MLLAEAMKGRPEYLEVVQNARASGLRNGGFL